MATPTHRQILRPVREAIDVAIQALADRMSKYVQPQTGFGDDPKNITHLVVKPHGMESFVIEVYVQRGRITTKTDLDMLPPECYGGLLPRSVVYNTINNVRDIQDERHGTDKPQSLPGFLLLFQQYLNKAEVAWITDKDPLGEVTKLAALCVACLEKYGIDGSPITTDDIAR